MEFNSLSSQVKQQVLLSPERDTGGLNVKPINLKKRQFDHLDITEPVNQTSNSTDSFESNTRKSWEETLRSPSQRPAVDRPRSAPLTTPLLAPSQGSRMFYASSGAFEAQQQQHGLQKTSARTHHDQLTTALDNQVISTDANSTALHNVRSSLGTLENTQYCPGQAVSTEFRLLQCDATAGLLEFFSPRHTAMINELALLKGLADLWAQGQSLFRAELLSYYEPVSQILELWLRERQVIHDLYRSTQTGASFTEERSVEQLLILNELRAIRLHLERFGQFQGRHVGDLLNMALGVLTNTAGLEKTFANGLARLDSELKKSKLLSSLNQKNSKIIMPRHVRNNLESHISVDRNKPMPIQGMTKKNNRMPPSLLPQHEPAGSSGTFNKPIVIDKGESNGNVRCRSSNICIPAIKPNVTTRETEDYEGFQAKIKTPRKASNKDQNSRKASLPAVPSPEVNKLLYD